MYKSIIAGLLFLCAFIVVADNTKSCNATQQGRCGNYCQSHQGMQSCIIDISTRSGTCTCNDGTSRTKSG